MVFINCFVVVIHCSARCLAGNVDGKRLRARGLRTPDISSLDSLDGAQARRRGNDRRVTYLEEEFGVTIQTLVNEITVSGGEMEEVELAEAVLTNLRKIIRQ